MFYNQKKAVALWQNAATLHTFSRGGISHWSFWGNIGSVAWRCPGRHTGRQCTGTKRLPRWRSFWGRGWTSWWGVELLHGFLFFRVFGLFWCCRCWCRAWRVPRHRWGWERTARQYLSFNMYTIKLIDLFSDRGVGSVGNFDSTSRA